MTVAYLLLVRPRGRRLGIAVLAFSLAAASAGTLWPFDFELSSQSVGEKWAIAEWELTYDEEDGEFILDRDLVVNLLLLVPTGAGWALMRRGRRVGRIAAESAPIGLLISVAIELGQLLTPDRVTQLADVWRGTVGCAAGAALVAWLDRDSHSVARTFGRRLPSVRHRSSKSLTSRRRA